VPAVASNQPTVGLTKVRSSTVDPCEKSGALVIGSTVDGPALAEGDGVGVGDGLTVDAGMPRSAPPGAIANAPADPATSTATAAATPATT
jgi:hypothetical protein